MAGGHVHNRHHQIQITRLIWRLAQASHVPTVPNEFESNAFRLAVLRSERRRIIGILFLLGVLAVLVVVRTVLSGVGVTEDSSFKVGTGAAAMALVLTLVGVGYECVMLRLVRGAIKEERSLPAYLWPINIVVETMLPTLSVLMLAHLGLTSGYRALVAPTVFIYFFFIILSSLRLCSTPRICR